MKMISSYRYLYPDSANGELLYNVKIKTRFKLATFLALVFVPFTFTWTVYGNVMMKHELFVTVSDND